MSKNAFSVCCGQLPAPAPHAGKKKLQERNALCMEDDSAEGSASPSPQSENHRRRLQLSCGKLNGKTSVSLLVSAVEQNYWWGFFLFCFYVLA